jgi:OmpA-OmpF porin, OOP family
MSTRLQFWFLSLLLVVATSANAQIPSIPGLEPGNLVPNPGFELFDTPPIGWFLSGKDFTYVMRYWESPTGASPDAYGPSVIVPNYWKEKGFGNEKPHLGEHMVGITTYGCDGKPHCREYLQIQLSEPLIPGQKYYGSFWVHSLPSSHRNNNLGMAFVSEQYELSDDRILRLKPAIKADHILGTKKADWIQITGEFVAKSSEEYLLIGNFYPDSLTSIFVTDKSLPYGYYYIDDVLLKKLPPFLQVEIGKDDITRQKFETGSTIQLKNVYFEFDRSELLPRSVVELKKLISILKKYPTMKIQINGHTDAMGSDTYNQTLSEDRAASVVNFLIAYGIETDRLSSKGFGRSQPVADNATDSGRQLNRRVEITVLSR